MSNHIKSLEPTNLTSIPLLPLRGITVFPGMLLHFDVGRKKSVKAIETAMNTDRMVFLVTQKEVLTDDPARSDLFEVGTVAKIHQILKLPGDNIRVLVEGISRAVLADIFQTEPFIGATVKITGDASVRASDVHSEAIMRKAKKMFIEYANMLAQVSPDIIATITAVNKPGELADMIVQNIQTLYEEKQTILAEFHPIRRLRKLITLLSRESEILRLELGISDKVSEQMDKNQKEYFLREQIKAIQEELGEGEDSALEAEDYKEKVYALNLPEEHTQKLLKEVSRLEKTQYASPESGVIRTYLDCCLELPWNTVSKERNDIKAAAKILDADHYGLEKVKERVLEFLSVRQLADKPNSQILCLIGPPGTGKTSIASSIARAAGRKFARISLGGVRDEADIRGHRKTYVGAMPGRIMNALKQAGTKNCVILLDEIDKMGNDFRGDPASAMLEVLDGEQNNAFRDHFIEIPFDLSQVMFITTANSYDTIPAPLLDRMEILDIEGYTDEEKVCIAEEHLIPKELKKHGLKKSILKISDDAVRKIAENYTREAGVRSLEREIAKICRKTAKKYIDGEIKRVSVTEDNLTEFLGTPKYKREMPGDKNEVGVVNGLAWTSVGGELLEVEAGVVDGSGKLELTGNLGDVMKESAKAALTYIRSRTDSLGIDHDFYKTKDIHIHFPEGATPKDGPSAGITTATAIISALTAKPVRCDIAMTGEITLRGRVLPIGGLKEKTMAAYRAGIKTVIIPEENVPDLDEIDKTVRAGLRFVPVSHMDEVIEETLADKIR